MPVPTRKASLSIKFIIVGGGIAGLSCGYALQTAGHQVVILEQSDGKSKTEGSIRSPPNMTRILCKWPGMLALLKTCATKCSGISFRDGKTSEPLGFMKFHEQIMSELEADFLVLQYEDLCRHLTFLCVGTGVEFKYASKAVNIKSVGGSVTVVLEDGRNVEGDIAIGADGHNSLVRSIVAEEDLEPIHVVPGANISILTQLMQEDEDLRDLCNTHQSEFTIWMGSGSSMTGTFDANAETFNLSICSMTTLDSPDSEWYENYPLSKMTSFEFSGYDPRLQKLIQLGYAYRPTLHKIFEIEDVVGLDGKVVLVGDAAHSVLVHGSHNSSMAIEDAVTLGTLFSHLTHRRHIPLLLNAYEEIRHPRTSATQTSEYQSLSQISLPSGAHQEARDEALRLTLSKTFEDFENCEDSDMLVEAWEQYLVLFSHDASEEADSWWSKWGAMMERTMI